MKKDPKEISSEILESLQEQPISALEECFAKLRVGSSPSKSLEEQLSSLNLGDEKGTLIERGPIKNTKQPRKEPYHTVTGHNCGGTYIWTTNSPQRNVNYNNLPVYNYPEIQTTNVNLHQYRCTECFEWFGSETCVLEITSTPEFTQWLDENIALSNSTHLQPAIQESQHIIQQSQPNITNNILTATETSHNILNDFKTNCAFRKPQVRRISHESQDSGCYSDNPSPRSDLAPSPVSAVVTQFSKPDTQTKQYRKILPKTPEMQRKNETVTCTSPKTKNVQTKQKNTDTKAKSAQELLKAILDEDIKRVKWIDVVVQKSSDEVFGASQGETVLHKLLRSKENYLAESFYVLVEKMKQHPNKCLHIVAAQASICDALRENKHPKLWIDYFCEAIQIIENKLERSKATN